jgi:hypothetical protein
METPTQNVTPVALDRLVRLYRRASAAALKSNALLQECSEMEKELFGTTRNDTDRDELIDRLEYASGGGSRFTVREIREIWNLPNARAMPSGDGVADESKLKSL